MELFRALAVLVEPPGEVVGRVAESLGMGAVPAAAEYTELFVFQLYPYASVYVGAEGMLGGEARDVVGGFWRALGQTPPAEADHLAVMLALYARLCELAAGESDVKGRAGWERARKAFLWEHLLSWLAVYLRQVLRLGGPFYRRWSEILMEALLAEARVVGQPEALPLQLRVGLRLVDPRGEGKVGEFLQSLLAPARSGMILTRADLSRAARQLGLGVRIGERAFTLRALFGQNAEGVLEWLAAEAGAWREYHEDCGAALGVVAEAWAEKARAAATLLLELKRETTAAMGSQMTLPVNDNAT